MKAAKHLRFLAFLSACCLLTSPCWAAITNASLTSGSDIVDASSFTTASITPTANRLIIVVVANRDATTPTPVPTISGNNLTYVEIANVAFVTRRRITMFRAMGASPTTGVITIDMGGDTQENCRWSVYEFDGVDTTGTNGSGAVVQSATNSANAASLTVTLAAFGSTDNGATAGFGKGNTQDTVNETGWTEIHDVTSEGASIETQWRVDNDTTASASWTTASGTGGIAIEIKAAAAAGGAVIQGATFQGAFLQ